jgi:hypothetical protein
MEVPDGKPCTDIDPCALIVITRFAGPEEDQDAEQFFCHLECFRKVVEPHAQVTLG